MTEKYNKWIGLGAVVLIVTIFLGIAWAATQEVPAEEPATAPASDEDPCAGEPEDCQPLNWSSQPLSSYDAST